MRRSLSQNDNRIHITNDVYHLKPMRVQLNAPIKAYPITKQVFIHSDEH
jgi:hypothetical protein